MLDRAYSLLEIKSIDVPARKIRGIATTPTPDRLGDVIDPLGATYAAEIPLLLHHRKETPVGVARLGPATAAGIPFEAELPVIDDPGPVRDEVNRAWTSITAKPPLMRGASIGFRPRGLPTEALERMATGGMRYRQTEILELSLVTVPANQDATIALVRSLDQAASGQTSPGAAGPFPVVARMKAAPAMTYNEQITQWSNTRAPKAEKLAGLMKTAADTGVTLDPAQSEEYDTLKADIQSIDKHLARLAELETMNKVAAVPITATPPRDGLVVAGRPAVQVKANVPDGTGFARFCQAMAASKGNLMLAENFAKRWDDSTPEVGLVFKAAVAAGTTTDATWAGPLAPLRPLSDQFMALLRPATLLGRIPNLRAVPFNVSVPIQTGGGTYKWVGQGAPKPVGSLAFQTLTLGITKCAGIIVITDELARNSSPAAEDVIRRDMIAGISAFLDVEFTDPTKAAVAGTSPGSITNGVTPITSAGTSPANGRTDLVALVNAMTAAGISVAGASFLMSETNAGALGFSLNSLGQRIFPDLNATGGSALGIPVIPSQSCGGNVILVSAPNVLYADDGGVTIDVSTEASLQMDSAPMNPADATVVMTSLWQNNEIGLRAERYVNWKRGRAAAVQYTVQVYVG
jgi:HK97 family phage major capsid protein